MATGDDSTTPAVPDPADEPTPGADRDWDAEWKTITADLAPRRGAYLRSDLPTVGAGQGPRDYTPVEDPDADHYIPDPPEARVAMSTRTRLAWTCLIAGPALLLLAVLAFDRAPVWYVAASIGIFLVGCIIGFLRLPTHKDDGGDGAAV